MSQDWISHVCGTVRGDMKWRAYTLTVPCDVQCTDYISRTKMIDTINWHCMHRFLPLPLSKQKYANKNNLQTFLRLPGLQIHNSQLQPFNPNHHPPIRFWYLHTYRPLLGCTATTKKLRRKLLPEGWYSNDLSQRRAPKAFAFWSPKWAMLKRSFIPQGRKELLTPPLTHQLRGHSASVRVEIPVFCLRASLRWLTHLKVLLPRAVLWPPPFLLYTERGVYSVAQMLFHRTNEEIHQNTHHHHRRQQQQ